MTELENILQSASRRDLLKGSGALAIASTLEAVFPFLSGNGTANAVPRSRDGRPLSYQINTEHALPLSRTRKRTSTLYIILHTTEGEFEGSLNKIKRNANAHYLVDRDGTVYPIVNGGYWANHAGKSMWEGRENISDVSLGVEIVGYHYAPLTEQQYVSLKALVKELQNKYRILDRGVLGHYQVAYGVNRWTGGEKARGRKKDGINIDWEKLGIRHRTDDPDVAAGRVKPDKLLASIIAQEERNRRGPIERYREVYGSNVIAAGKTAWTIAGDEYDQPTTFYIFPNKEVKAGTEISDWSAIPVGTRIYLNTNRNTVTLALKPVITIEKGETVWQKVQAAYNDKETYYISSDGRYITSGEHADFRRIAPGTRIVLGVRTLYKIGPDKPPIKVERNLYNTEQSIYVLTDGAIKTGKEIRDFRNFPRDTPMLVKR